VNRRPSGDEIVIFDDPDYDWARDAAAAYPKYSLLLQPGNDEVDPNGPPSIRRFGG